MQLTTEAFFRKPSQIISRDILQEASLAMYYWATDNKPDLTHSSHSVMKKWSFRVQFFFQSMIRWFQNLLVLNYSYAFESSFASASLIMLDYTLAHTWLYSWAHCVLSQAMVFRFHQWLHWEQEKEKNRRFTAKLSRNVIEKNCACLLSKWKSNPSFQSALCLTFWYGNKYWLVNKNYRFIDYSHNY